MLVALAVRAKSDHLPSSVAALAVLRRHLAGADPVMTTNRWAGICAFRFPVAMWKNWCESGAYRIAQPAALERLDFLGAEPFGRLASNGRVSRFSPR